MSTSVSAAPNTNIMLDGPAVADTSRGVVALEVSAPMARFTVPPRVAVIPIRNKAKEVVAHVLVDADDAEWVNRWNWYRSGTGYVCRNSMLDPDEPAHVFLHRALMGLRPGDGLYADHINRDRLDNRRANLRVVTPAEAAQNKPAIRGRFRGVYWDARRRHWTAHAQLNGRLHHIGRFDTEEEAARAAGAWRREHMPFSEDAAS